MRYLKAFGAFWWDFLVGDEPRLAAGAVAAVAILFWAVLRAARRSTMDARDDHEVSPPRS